MRMLCAAVAIALVVVSTPASAPAQCVDLCQLLTNGGFALNFASWTCSQPNDNYQCPIVPGIETGGPDGNFVEVENLLDDDVAGKVTHDAQAASFAAGQCFQVRVLAQRGRYTGGGSGFTSAPPTLHLAILGWRAGDQPIIDLAEDAWSRRPAMNCKSKFVNWAAPDVWSSETFTCTAPQDLAWVSLTLAGVNHSRDTYVAFDCDTR